MLSYQISSCKSNCLGVGRASEHVWGGWSPSLWIGAWLNHRNPTHPQLCYTKFRRSQSSALSCHSRSNHTSVAVIMEFSIASWQACSPQRTAGGSLTSRGMPLMSGLQHLGGKQTRAAAQRPSEGVSVDAWRECGDGGAEQKLHACRWTLKQQKLCSLKFCSLILQSWTLVSS